MSLQEEAMRKTALALFVLGCVVLPARSQPFVAAALHVQRTTLDAHLRHWEEAMKHVNTLAIACTRTETDAIFKTRRTYGGTIHFMKPTSFFWAMSNKEKPDEYERFICTGPRFYQYLPSQKLINVFPFPNFFTKALLGPDSPTGLLFHMTVAEAKAHHDFQLHKVDTNYLFLDVTPKRAAGKANFVKAHLVLDKNTYLPRQLWLQHPNGGEVLWDLTAVRGNTPIGKAAFAAPVAPKGWAMIQMPVVPKPAPKEKK